MDLDSSLYINFMNDSEEMSITSESKYSGDTCILEVVSLIQYFAYLLSLVFNLVSTREINHYKFVST